MIFFRFPIAITHGMYVIPIINVRGLRRIIIRVTRLIVLYKGSWALLPVASLNQRKLIVVLEYCLAPTTVAVVFLLCDPLAYTLFTRVSRTKQAFFFLPLTRAIVASSHCFTYKFFPLILVPFIAQPVRVTIWPYNSQQNSLV